MCRLHYSHLAIGGRRLIVMVIFSLVRYLSDGGIMIGITIWLIIPNYPAVDNLQWRKCMQVPFLWVESVVGESVGGDGGGIHRTDGASPACV